MFNIKFQILLLLITTVLPLLGQNALDESVEVRNPRPVAAAADLLALKYGEVVNYEDPPYWDPADIDAASDPRVPIPKWGAITVRFPKAPAARDEAGLALSLRSAIEKYESASYAGRFRLDQSSGALTILPVGAKDAGGRMTSAESPLDTLVTFGTQDRTLWELVGEIARQITAASGKKVVVGTVPTNNLQLTRVAVGATGDTARSVLSRAFSERRWADSSLQGRVPLRKLAWRLLYAPGHNYYVLNLKIAEREVQTPQGNTTRVPLSEPPLSGLLK